MKTVKNINHEAAEKLIKSLCYKGIFAIGGISNGGHNFHMERVTADDVLSSGDIFRIEHINGNDERHYWTDSIHGIADILSGYIYTCRGDGFKQIRELNIIAEPGHFENLTAAVEQN